ncbi:MAG: hypothetical protein J7L98_01315 [Candidatus Verstraetearchaeota archaeon]|nr:hypothetical protein [Candidatus Verstraetearchaeota archaeon]
MTTARSDLDFWVMLYGEASSALKCMKDLFKEAVVEPAFKEINSKYPRIRLCGASVRIFLRVHGEAEKPSKIPRRVGGSGLVQV